MATYLDLLPLELTDIIYEKKHKMEMSKTFSELNDEKRRFLCELSHISDYEFDGEIGEPDDEDTHIFNNIEIIFSNSDLEKYCPKINPILLDVINVFTGIAEEQELRENLSPVQEEFVDNVFADLFPWAPSTNKKIKLYSNK